MSQASTQTETESQTRARMLARAADLVARYAAAGRRIATAESCTGGLIAGLLTAVPGSSAVLERGFVTYSNEAKTGMLGVPAETIAAHGAVSEATARAMAEGALRASLADVAVAVTGVAGPGGGSPAKPVGLVHLALAARDDAGDRSAPAILHLERRYGDLGREPIRARTVEDALHLLERALAEGAPPEQPPREQAPPEPAPSSG